MNQVIFGTQSCLGPSSLKNCSLSGLATEVSLAVLALLLTEDLTL